MARCHSECGCRNTWTRKRNVNDIAVARGNGKWCLQNKWGQADHSFWRHHLRHSAASKLSRPIESHVSKWYIHYLMLLNIYFVPKGMLWLHLSTRETEFANRESWCAHRLAHSCSAAQRWNWIYIYIYMYYTSSKLMPPVTSWAISLWKNWKPKKTYHLIFAVLRCKLGLLGYMLIARYILILSGNSACGFWKHDLKGQCRNLASLAHGD